MEWKECDQSKPLPINISDQVIVVGYSPTTTSITVRLSNETADKEYTDFIDECTTAALSSPAVGPLAKDAKVWAKYQNYWYRAKVETITSQKVTAVIQDLGLTITVAKDQLRLLQSKELFFRPKLTRTFRLKGMRQKDVMSSAIVRNMIERAMEKLELFTVSDNANNYIDLKYDGTPKSFNQSLLVTFERQTGIADEEPEKPVAKVTTEVAPVPSSGGDLVVGAKPTEVPQSVPIFTMDNISYPEYEPQMNKPNLFVFNAASDGMNWVINAMNFKHASDVKLLCTQVDSCGKALFKADFPGPPSSYDSIDLNQLCLIQTATGFDRCFYKTNEIFESIDTGVTYDNLPLAKVRFLTRELISCSYLMTLLLDDDHVEDMEAMEKKLKGLNMTMVNSIDTLIHMGDNSFKCIWKKA